MSKHSEAEAKLHLPREVRPASLYHVKFHPQIDKRAEAGPIKRSNAANQYR